MAFLYISEYAALGYVGQPFAAQLIQAPAGVPIAEQKLGVSGSSVTSASFNATTKFIRVVSDTACNLAFGGTGTSATTASHLLPANAIVYYGVNLPTNLAVIANS